MSYREGLLKPLNGLSFTDKTDEEVKYLFHDVLADGMHGLCFSAYEQDQKPGDQISKEQVQKRMEIIAPFTQWVRSFSCLEGHEHIARVAKAMNKKTLVGAWLGKDKAKNEAEIAALIALAKEGMVDIAAVGNEVLYRKDLSEEELLAYMYRVKEALPDVSVAYVDAYYEFVTRPQLTAACDLILTNCYPFWEGCLHEYSMVYMKQMYQQAKTAARGKKVIITETGWPSQGQSVSSAKPSVRNAMTYFINTQMWSKDEDIDIFYFTSFDEAWKTEAEGGVGAHWGLWDKHEKLKY